MNWETKNSYKGITKKDIKNEIRLLNKEIKHYKYHLRVSEECKEYLKTVDKSSDKKSGTDKSQ